MARPLLLAVLAAALGSSVLAAGGAAGDVPRLTQATPAATPALGHDRIGVRRGEEWLLRDSLEGGPARSYREGPAWRAVAGDTDGDGTDSLHLFKDGVWLLRDTERALPRVVQFGAAGDVPLLGDWDGDGTDTLAVFRAGRWSLRDGNGLTGTARSFAFGSPGDVPVVGDWDADGDSDLAVRRGATWFQRDSSTPGPASRRFEFGLPGDVPVAGDWDHDGRDSPGLFRDGTWFFRTSGPERSVTTRFGARGDQPVIRRVRGLAPGVQHRVLRNPAVPYTAHVATVDLAAASSPDTVLAQDRLRGLEVVSSMARRTGAVLAVNGDYALDDGRPVHLFASDGQLAQTPQLLGRALSLDARGTQVRMGFPDLRLSLSPNGVPGAPGRLSRFNSGGPLRGELAAYTAVGAGLPGPPRDACYAGVRPAGGRTMGPDGTVRTPLQVTGARCGGAPAAVPPTGAMLAGGLDSTFLRTIRPGQALQLTAQLGFPGAVDVLGGNPLLVVDGRVVEADVDGSGGFFARNPRTAVGVTAKGSLLVVVVDGRQGAYSSGATLRETAELMRALGAVTAINLDGGGSSEMWVNGLVATRPSDGRERPVSSALTVLRGADTGQSGLAPAQSPSGTGAAAEDPASTGGLLDALQRDGVPLPVELVDVAERFAG